MIESVVKKNSTVTCIYLHNGYLTTVLFFFLYKSLFLILSPLYIYGFIVVDDKLTIKDILQILRISKNRLLIL